MAKLKIVQVECFYHHFLETAYQRQPWLAEQSSDTQTAFLLDSGFSGGHNVIPYLNPSRWSSRYIISNCRQLQARWAEENGFRAEGLAANEILALQLETINPDVLYLSDIPGFDFAILKRLKKRPFVVGWHATIVDERIAWHEFDLVLSGIAALRERAMELGAKAAVCFMPGAPAYKIKSNPSRRTGDIVFSGSYVGGIHNERVLQHRKLAEQLRHGAELHVYSAVNFPTEPAERLRFFAPVYGNDVIELYSRYGIVIDARGNFLLGDGALRETSNMRIFETTRAGALLLTENSSNLERYFEVGREIETYASTEELIDKANFYCAPENREARLRVALAGHERTVREHLVEHRAAWFERILDEQFGLSRGATAAGAGLPAAARKPHVICTSINAQSLLFGIECVRALAAQYGDVADIRVHCGDDMSQALLDGLGLGVLSFGNDVFPAADDDAFRSDGDWRALRLLGFLRDACAGAARITYVDPAVELRRPGVLEFAADDAVVLLDHAFGPGYGHARETLGGASFALLSIGGEAAWRFADIAAGASRRGSGWAELAAGEAAAAGIAVRRIGALAPWNFAAVGEAQQDVSLFFLLGLRGGSIWEFLTFSGETSWPDFYQTVCVPYFQRVQALTGMAPALARLDHQVSSLSSSPLAAYMMRREHLLGQGCRLLGADEFEALPALAAPAFDARGGDAAALATVMKRVLRADMSLLEEGCGLGDGGEFVAAQVGGRLDYTGVDARREIVDLARVQRPQAMFAAMPPQDLQYGDEEFDIVLAQAAAVATPALAAALREARRVARRFVVLQGIKVADLPRHLYYARRGAGGEAADACLSTPELARLLAENRLHPVLMADGPSPGLDAVAGTLVRAVSLACQCVPAEEPGEKTVENFNYYCTYFDSNYLARGALMMRSLTAYDPRAFFFVLCLDATAAEAVRAIGTNMMAIGVDELMAADPEFAAARDNRTQIEWYFTATSSFVNYLLDKYGKLQRLTYLDADLFFYSSPEFMHYEAEGASVQIIEHRFGAGLESLEVYGRFNVGWISFTNSEEGRRVVAEYRANCIEWCYDRLEGDRFGDQKYLDRWPEKYPHCCISQIKGANVAPWNLSRWTPRSLGPHLFIDEDRLVFFHFQGIRREAPGKYATNQDRANFGMYYDLLYAPYLRDLGAMDLALAPLIEKIEVRDIRYNSW